MKSALLVNFTNTLQATFVPIFFCQKITKPNSKKKTVQNTRVQKTDRKILVKLTYSLLKLNTVIMRTSSSNLKTARLTKKRLKFSGLSLGLG